MENLLTFCATRVHTDVGEDVFFIFLNFFLLDSRSFGSTQVGMTFACDLILHGGMHHCGAERLFLHFPGTNDFSFPEKRNMLMLSSSSSLSLFLSPSGFHCISSLNDSVTVPHQRMSHSTTLLLWWFLPSVYYIMQQRVLLSYIHHNKHSPSASISTEQRVY